MVGNIIKFKKIILNNIETEGKPGKLVDLNIDKICQENNIYFNISKCFYINDLNSELSRGNHSNYNASEILVCLNGSFDIKLHDGKNEIIFKLNKNEAIFIDKHIWIEFYNFKDCIIMAFVHILKNNTKNSCYNFDEFLMINENNI